MSRLVSIALDDFQPWEQLTVEFDPYLTCIVGSNGVGKSSLIRALRWVVFNRPLGDSVVRWGTKGARVKLLTEDHKVVREKRDGANIYRLDGKKYTAFGTNPPSILDTSLRLSEVNFQTQISPPFWLSQAASEVAREMNQVVDLEVIDRSMSFSTGRIKTTGTEVKLLEEMVAEAEARIEALSWVPAAERLLLQATRIAQDCAGTLQRLEGMVSLVSAIREAQTTICDVPDVSAIEELNNEIDVARSRLEGLSDLVSSINDQRELWLELSTLIGQLEVQVEEIKPKTCPSCGQSLPDQP